MKLNSDHLFAEDDLGSFIREERDKLIQEVDGYQRQYVLSLEIEAVCEELYRKYQHEAPKLKIDRIYIKESGESGKGTFVTFAVPFDGDPVILLVEVLWAMNFTSHTPSLITTMKP
jgi:hypothetical protein